MQETGTDCEYNPNKQIGFTVVTPVFNREDCIQRCIKSVIDQNYTNLEHWIVDDGSTDNTVAIIEKYAHQYPFIKHHRFDRNKGVNAARNYAIQNSTNDFVLFLDSDDYFVENALNHINNHILANQGYSHYLFNTSNRLEYYDQNDFLKEERVEISFADFLMGKVGGDFLHVMKNQLIRSFPFDEQLRVHEGLNFLRIYKAGEKLLYIKETAVVVEQGRTDSVTKETRLTNKKALNKKYLVLKENLALFEQDYVSLHAENTLSDLIKRRFIFGTALGKYNENKQLKAMAKRLNVKIPWVYQLICFVRLGFILRNTLFAFSYFKHTILSSR